MHKFNRSQLAFDNNTLINFSTTHNPFPHCIQNPFFLNYVTITGIKSSHYNQVFFGSFGIFHPSSRMIGLMLSKDMGGK
jgi:hypothetical protein